MDNLTDSIRYHNNSLLLGQLLNVSINQNGSLSDVTEGDGGATELNELQLIKAIVLIVVVTILLLSTCRVLFKTFSRYGGKREEM